MCGAVGSGSEWRWETLEDGEKRNTFCSTLPVLDYKLLTVIDVRDWLETEVKLFDMSVELRRLFLTEN